MIEQLITLILDLAFNRSIVARELVVNALQLFFLVLSDGTEASYVKVIVADSLVLPASPGGQEVICWIGMHGGRHVSRTSCCQQSLSLPKFLVLLEDHANVAGFVSKQYLKTRTTRG